MKRDKMTFSDDLRNWLKLLVREFDDDFMGCRGIYVKPANMNFTQEAMMRSHETEMRRGEWR